MDATTMVDHIAAFDGVRCVEHQGDTFFVYDPDNRLTDQRWLPLATVVTGDHYDTVSALEPPGAYRLNIGLTKQGYHQRLGPPPTRRGADGVLLTGADYAARDRLLPHPHYAAQYWVCIVCPGARTAAQVPRLLAEAHELAARRYTNRRARGG